MSTALGHRLARTSRRVAPRAQRRPRVELWLAAACVLGSVLFARMIGLQASRAAPTALLTIGLIMGTMALLVATPIRPARSLDAATLYAMSPARFERYVAHLFATSGYAVRLVGGSGDGGVDVRVWRDGTAGVVQCKRYRPDRSLGPAAVRELVGTRTHERVRIAWLATTAPLSPAAQLLADEEGIIVLDAQALASWSRTSGRWWRRAPHQVR